VLLRCGVRPARPQAAGRGGPWLVSRAAPAAARHAVCPDMPPRAPRCRAGRRAAGTGGPARPWAPRSPGSVACSRATGPSPPPPGPAGRCAWTCPAPRPGSSSATTTWPCPRTSPSRWTGSATTAPRPPRAAGSQPAPGDGTAARRRCPRLTSRGRRNLGENQRGGAPRGAPPPTRGSAGWCPCPCPVLLPVCPVLGLW